MDNIYDYKRFAVLYVDDEEMSLKYFSRAFQDQFRLFTAKNAQEGFQVFDAHKDEIGVVIADQRMPGEPGVRLLEKTRQARPHTIRILTTAYTDLQVAIDAVNSGAVYKYVTKPWDVPQLEMTIKRGLEFFLLQRERDFLLQEKLSTLHNLMITDRVISLGLLAAGLSRHLRNSLTAVRTFIELAPSKLAEEKLQLERLRNPNYWHDFYNQVQQQLDRVSALLTKLVTAPEKPNLPVEESVQLAQVISDAMGTLKAESESKNIVVASQFPSDLPALQVERAKFTRLFELLLGNQISTLPKGCRIDLTAQGTTNGTGEPAVIIEIQDDGPGLPQEILRSLFDPFVLQEDGNPDYSVNLMAAYFIAYHHGGKIYTRNGDGGGSRFTITLPVSPRPSATADDERVFLSRVLMNDSLWEKLLAGD